MAKFVFTDEKIREAVKDWFGDEVAATAKYGHMKDWETLPVTDMKELFMDRHNFTGVGIFETWNTSNVETTEKVSRLLWVL